MDCIRSKIVITRKEHKCIGCYQPIPKGSRVKNTVTIDDGIYNCYTCSICEGIISRHDIEEFSEGDMICNYPEEFELIEKGEPSRVNPEQYSPV